MLAARAALPILTLLLAACSGGSPIAGTATAPTAAPTAAASQYADGVKTVLVNVGGVHEMSANRGQLWVITGSDVTDLDIATGQIHAVVVNGAGLDGIYAGDDAVWVADFEGDSLIKIDPTTYTVVDRIDMPSAEAVIEVNGTVWVANHHQGTVTLLDPTTDKIIKTITIGASGADGPSHMTFAFGSVWVGLANELQEVRVDPATDTVIAHIAVSAAGPCGGSAATSDALWVDLCSAPTNAVDKIDPQSNKDLASVTLAAPGVSPVVLNDSIWIPVTHEVDHLDPATGQINDHVSVPELGAGGPSVLVGDTLFVSDDVATVKAVPVSLLTAP